MDIFSVLNDYICWYIHSIHVALHNPTNNALMGSDPGIVEVKTEESLPNYHCRNFVSKNSWTMLAVWRSAVMLKDDTFSKSWHCIQFQYIKVIVWRHSLFRKDKWTFHFIIHQSTLHGHLKHVTFILIIGPRIFSHSIFGCCGKHIQNRGIAPHYWTQSSTDIVHHCRSCEAYL